MIHKDAEIVNRFMGMMNNWISEARTSYFKVRFRDGARSEDIVVASTREGFYARGFGWKRIRKEYLKGASMMDPNIVKGASIIEGFLKGAYKFIGMGSDCMVDSGRHYSYMGFHRGW